jgi:UDP-N-acetylglucosamine--N-acetylmuramyl-(pentapeptide) pyrophosphoryl-undecaprenol N-acetylglucosamine transferase
MAIEKALPEFHKMGVQLLWQTGKNYSVTTNSPAAVVHQFIDDMAGAYAAADLVVCRSGGSTVAELTIAGKASILIPYPYAVNNEQEHNARALANRGAAVLLMDSEVAGMLQTLISKTLSNSTELRAMELSVQMMAKPDAAATAAEQILKLVRAV